MKILKVFIIQLFVFYSCSTNEQNIENTLSDIQIGIIAEIGTEDQQFEYQLGQPVSVRTDDAGQIYIADRANLTVKVFDENGDFLRTFGGRGRGPGEFQEINTMEITPNGDLFFLDRGKLEYIYMNQLGKYISSFPIKVTPNEFQYYPHRLHWYGDLTLGIRNSAALPEIGLPPFDRPLFHVYSSDFQEHFNSFFSFNQIDYKEKEMFIWNSLGYLPGSFDMKDDLIKFIYSPGVYNGKLYEFTYTDDNWQLSQIMEATSPTYKAFDIYLNEEEYNKYEGISGVNKIFYRGGPYIGRLYSIDTGVYYLNDGRIAHFYGEWRGGDTTLDEGNTLDLFVQVINSTGTVENQGYLMSLDIDSRPSLTLVNWKDEYDNFYLLNLSRNGIPTVKKFRLDLLNNQ
jgi:hypothetical protein